jgi:acyl carrier protein
MNQSEVIEKLQSVFDSIFLESVVVTPGLTAKDVAEWNSLTHVTLILAVERAFHLRFRVGEVETTRNVGEFADLILKKVG